VTEHTVDSRGRRCPLPIIDLAAAARGATEGTVITLIADDPAAAADVAAWCRMRGQTYVGSEPVDQCAVAYRVRITSV
jgi:tRNA 2-thiouridine synthesizing protein A